MYKNKNRKRKSSTLFLDEILAKKLFTVWKIFREVYICNRSAMNEFKFRDSSMVEHSAVIPTSRDVDSNPECSTGDLKRKKGLDSAIAQW
jgi:hypothetical protein